MRDRRATRRSRWRALLFGTCLLGLGTAYPLPENQGNSTLNLPSTAPGSPEFVVEDAFPDLSFEKPVALASPPGETDRLFVVEQPGRVMVIEDLENPSAAVFLDISDRVVSDLKGGEAGLLGIAFHPEYQDNRTFFLFYTTMTETAAGEGLHDRLARFQTSQDDANRALPGSEVPLITQYDEHPNHNAGDLQFGPEGYLYVSLGDEGGSFSEFRNSQRIDQDFFSSILRIDVDERPDSLEPNPHPASHANYGIPPDNPFVGVTLFNGRPVDPREIRTEFYAVGLRNPWRMDLDSETGQLYFNDVGQDRREEVNILIPGGNYGWPGHEGVVRHDSLWEPFYEESFLISPITDYGHDKGNSIAGSLLYRGDHYDHLEGTYLFTDFWGGRIGAIHYAHTALADRVSDLQGEIAALQRQLRQTTPELEAARKEWEARRRDDWQVLSPREALSTEGATLEELDDHSILVMDENPSTDQYSVVAETHLDSVEAIKLEALPHPSLPFSGPGRWPPQGNFVLSELKVYAASDEGEDFSQVPLRVSNSSFDQTGWTSDMSVDGDPDTGWGVYPEIGKAHHVTYELEKPLEGDAVLRFELSHQHRDGLNLGRFRLSVTDRREPIEDTLPEFIETLIRKGPSERPPQEDAILDSYYRTAAAPSLSEAREQLRTKQEALADLIVSQQREIEWLTNQRGISTMRPHPATGEILLANWVEGNIQKLVQKDRDSDGESLPTWLADTGAFADTATLSPEAGIIPYEINHPFWSDHADKRRWLSLPSTESPIQAALHEPWSSPVGSVFIKHFDLEMVRGVPESRRRLETRFLVRTDTGVYGITYRWDDSQERARLVPEGGMEETFTISDNGRKSLQTWRYPSRNECQRCHTYAGGHVLGLNTAQMNRTILDNGKQTSQIEALAEAGYLDSSDLGDEDLPRLARLDDPNTSVFHRVRSYFSANCVQCHQPGAPSRGSWDARFDISLEETGLIDGEPGDPLDHPDSRLIMPGSTEESVLFQRVASLGPHHMPPVATKAINQTAVDLLADWIRNELPNHQADQNIPPTIELTRPLPHAGFAPGEAIKLTAGAADSDGRVEEVTFFAGSEPIDTVRQRPYKLTWEPSTPQAFSISAVATDDQGGAASSESRTIYLTSQLPLVQRIEAVENGSLRLQVSGVEGAYGILERSFDLKGWTPVTTNLLQGQTWTVEGMDWTDHDRQFFRIRRQEFETD